MRRSRLEYYGDSIHLFRPRRGLSKKIFGLSKRICNKCRDMCIDEEMWKFIGWMYTVNYLCKECAPTKNDAVRYFYRIDDSE